MLQDLYIFILCVLLSCMCRYHVCTQCPQRPERVSGTLELELETAVSCREGAGNRIQALCKSNKASAISAGPGVLYVALCRGPMAHREQSWDRRLIFWLQVPRFSRKASCFLTVRSLLGVAVPGERKSSGRCWLRSL